MGTSGSGKTTAGKLIDRVLKSLYPDLPHYILDTQGLDDFDNYSGIIESNRAPTQLAKKGQYIIWRPIVKHPQEIEKWLWGIFDGGPSILLIDELYALKYKGAGNYSDAYSALQCAGRGRKITTITHTQKFGKINPDAYQQATHRLGFYMDGTYNKYIRSEMMKCEHCAMPDDKFGFYYQHINGRGNPEYYSSIQDFLGLGRKRIE